MKLLQTFCFLLALASLMLPMKGNCQETPWLLKGGHIIDPSTGDIQQASDLLIEGGKILAISPREVPQGIPEVDVTGKYLIPGLVDGHVHFFQSGGLYTRPDAIDLRAVRPYEEERAWLLAQAPDFFRRYLRVGITGVMDVGGPMTNYNLRDQAQGSQTAPWLAVTGPLISTYQPEAFQIEDPPIVKIHSPEEAVALVQKQLPYRPDFIKIWYIVTRGQTAESNLPIIRATIAESHKHGIKVAVHATQLNTARLAVEAGADILVHSVDDQIVDQDFLDLLKEKNITYIPTLMVSGKYSETFSQQLQLREEDFRYANPFALGSLFDLQHLPAELIPDYVTTLMSRPLKPSRRDSIMAVNLKLVWDAGINVVTGTDAGNIGTLHASSYFEEISRMEAAGLTPGDILKASTINAAKALGKADDMGTLAEGKLADILVLDKNPLEDLDNWQSPFRVIRAGHLIDPDTLLIPGPEEVAQQQLNAYNARNIEAFLACYDDSVKVYSFPGKLRYSGKENMRSNYSGFFSQTPHLHCELVNRMVLGKQVIDQEKVTGLPNGQVIEAIAIYKVEDGIIKEVYFMRP